MFKVRGSTGALHSSFNEGAGEDSGGEEKEECGNGDRRRAVGV